MLLAHHEYARETFASVIERHADGLLIVDGAGECRYANATCEQMAGERAVAEVQRWGPLELGAVHEVDIAGGVGELRVLPTSWEGEPAFMVMIRDVSELRAAESERARLEERVRQAQRLDSLGRLAGGVAHDFNNLLSVILGTAEFLSDGMGPDHAHAEDVAAIVDAALRGRELTQQMLAIGRQHHGSPRVTDIHELILGLRELMAKLLGEHVLFELDLCAGSGRVLIDPWQFEQIVLNLTGNARDAMNRGGSFSMSTRTCELDDEHAAPLAGGRYIELVARDTGEGMSPEVCEHIFDPFFTTKEVGEGTGLGLATVYGIVQLAGGSVRVDSEPGRGACFTILLPEDASEDDAASDDADAGEASGSGSASTKVASKGRELPQGSGRILLVEDEPTVRKLTARILERGGYEVKAASGPLEALELARGELEIDLVLTDVVMPEMSGPELVAELLAICGPLPVVYVSGYAKSTSAWLGDMPGFLPKPFTPAALLAKVAELLDGGE
nr:ATP-binding protein [Pseudenhygromyxa sp. WMMC2535]